MHQAPQAVGLTRARPVAHVFKPAHAQTAVRIETGAEAVVGALLRRHLAGQHDCEGCAVEVEAAERILSAMGPPAEAPDLTPARPPPCVSGGEGGGWLN